MKLSKHFMKRKIAGETILIPVGKMAVHFNGMITLNETGEFIVQCLEEGMEEEQIIEKMLEEYEVEESDARAEVKAFLEKCRETKVITD